MVGPGIGTPDFPGNFTSSFSLTVSQKIARADAMSDKNPEGALDIYAELLGAKMKRQLCLILYWSV